MRCDLAQRAVQMQAVLVHTTHLKTGHYVRQHALSHVAVLHHISDAGRRARIVLQHHEAAGLVAHDIGAADMHIGAERHVEPDHGFAVPGIAQHQLPRHHPVRQDFLPVIDVVQEHVERAHALDDTGLDLLPLGGGQHAGDQVERQDAIDRRSVGIDGESDAALQQVAFGVHRAAAQGLHRELRQPGAQQVEAGMRWLAAAHRLAEKAVRVIALEQTGHVGRRLGLGLGLRHGGLRHPWCLLRCSSLGGNWLRREANCDHGVTFGDGAVRRSQG